MKIWRGFVLLAAVLVLVFFPKTGSVVRAADSVIVYDFSGISIPEGQPAQLGIDPGTVQMMQADPSVINSFVQALAARYNSSEVSIDQSAEVNYLTAAVNGLLPMGTHIPAIAGASSAQPAVVTGDLGINGGNYVDINITTQTLAVFQNGTLAMTTPIVTGNVAAGHNTPQGAFSVLTKERERYLTGPNYKSYVHYWSQVVGGVGIHDATWRGSFGGNIYKTNGSHGCINVPYEVMPTLYNNYLQIGMPVIIHS
ncbi:Lipoprotein-anchoring transpeptidase ErfK/SrfK [Lachnospiraceae bacterium]|nr:Lipoprotein-anchoring transpeptidase ErfK/SrfK [Lachnospiraceae bacterium]